MQGVVLLNKTINKTSRDMVNELNHIFGIKKIGHTGTLDPIATGVLVMCIGRYTKLVEKLSSFQKEYVAEIKLGIKTDTLDITGNVLDEYFNYNLTEDQIKKVFKSLIGKQKQLVPKYSAKKVNGKKLYEYARKNEKVEIPTNNIEIYTLDLISFDKDTIKFKSLVSKGTYIRSLIESICNKLNVYGTMSKLERTKQGKFDISSSYTIDEIKEGNYKLLKTKDLFEYPEYNLNKEEYFKVKNGNKIFLNSNEEHIIMMYENNEIAIYKKNDNYYCVDIMLI